MSNVTRLKSNNMSITEEVYWYLKEHQDQLIEFTSSDLLLKLPHLTISRISSALHQLEVRIKVVEWVGKKNRSNVYSIIKEEINANVPKFGGKNMEGVTRNYSPGIKHPNIRKKPSKPKKPPVSKPSVVDEIDRLRDSLLECCIALEEIRKKIK
mgnify:CR=1 FL=1